MKMKCFKANAKVTVIQTVNAFAKANFKIAEVIIGERAVYMDEKCYDVCANFHNWEELLDSKWRNKNVVGAIHEPKTELLTLIIA